MEGWDTEHRVLDKKRTVLLLRSVLVISTSYLILFDKKGLDGGSIAYILALILSNLALALTPRHWFHALRFSAGLLLADTAVVLTGLYLTVGCFSQDFLIIYFFTIFLTTATSSVSQIAMGAAMISGLYGYWLWLTAGHILGAAEWLRLPFFFIVAVFYSYMTEETKHERYRREQAEQESEHLRFLLNLGDAFSQRTASFELIGQVGNLVQAAFPRLECRVHTEPVMDPHSGAVFVMHAHGHTFGALQVGTKDGASLSPDENQFCKVVALVAANALYTSKQTRAAQDGARLKEEFLSTLSHELRSPLHSILGNADIVADSLSGSSDALARESVERLRASGWRLLDLIERMLCFAELRAGRRSVMSEAVNLRELFAEFRQQMTDELAGRPIRFECEVAGDLPVLRTDRRKFRLMISALLSNAAKFTREGCIRLNARRGRGQALEITVQDTGIGVDPKDIEPIFEEFRQLDGSLTRRYEGLGLGLALARELATTLGGAVEVESEPQRGSTFRVQLPILHKRPAGNTIEARAPQASLQAAL
jgi:signal transduction histidine kinase